MDAIALGVARASLARTMEEVCGKRVSVVITRKGGKAVVLMALDEYTALEETAYLMRSATNARRLLDSIADLEHGASRGTPC
jgi:antitoxin YefM